MLSAYRGDIPIAEWRYLRELDFQKDFTMPSQWRRVATATLCGYCRNRTIKQNEPALFTSITGVKRERVRCQDCAGAAPPDLPATPSRDVERDPVSFGFAKAISAAPARTRGSLKQFADRYSPHNS